MTHYCFHEAIRGGPTFHTPSFGDEEFEIPPINLQNMGGPTAADEAATAEAVYASQQLGSMVQQAAMGQAMGQGGMMEAPMAYPGPQGPPPPDMYHQQMSMPPPPQPMHMQSEDSDDSTPLSQLVGGVKRPSPEPLMDNGIGGNGKAVKKPKVPKKKKKRDPNEPQKPVSAYALFFRDTQAAIKGQNPNASFGEVSKIVASMWDGLEADHKNVYKKKTEAAKKDYLKALAAYRASLVSRAAAEHSDTLYGASPVTAGSPPQGSLSPLQKKSPLLTSLMEGGSPHHHPQQYMAMSPPQGMLGSQQPLWANMHPMAQSAPMMQQHSSPQQMMMHSPPVTTSSYTADLMSAPAPSMSSPASSGGPTRAGAAFPPPQLCTRTGCPNPAIESHDWDQEYCSSECVVSHCRDVFTAWMAQRQSTNTFVK
ncbi:high mobility group protein, putative [Ixodes scapularis]|uniref:High mobility group protein, putative n=1 Tax=Ixodes scapularis TaxID=6945 RepID=B7PMF4_IXOSC|nr:high mobility group protein, putative [Ixodes scapularis]|eukprot:XP_002434952.1 high mobility group protein, putative [Ixodes scapularis]